MSKECKCGDPEQHAMAVSSAVLVCLMNAFQDRSQESKWRYQAHLLEQKFTTGHGRHYSYFLPSFQPQNTESYWD